MGKNYSHLTFADRLAVEKMIKTKMKIPIIAECIGVNQSTIYRELNRGRYMHTLTDLTEEPRYSAELADQKYRENLKCKGPDLKIGDDHELAKYIENKILNEDYSPRAVLGEIQRDKIEFKVMISPTTLYRYIDIGLFLNLTNKELPVKKNRKKKHKKVRKKQARANAGTSIEKRPKVVEDREEFGHWEMDTVVGAKGESKHSMLVLTERKTRKEIVRLLEAHTTEQVVAALDDVEREYGNLFYTVFKTITVDNGSEFADSAGLEKSALRDGNRTAIYYCHPYSSYERGSNENQNRLIRRWIPKGMNFDHMAKNDIQEIEDWINDYPRKIFEYETSRMRFEAELSKILLSNAE